MSAFYAMFYALVKVIVNSCYAPVGVIYAHVDVFRVHLVTSNYTNVFRSGA